MFYGGKFNANSLNLPAFCSSHNHVIKRLASMTKQNMGFKKQIREKVA